MADRPRSAPDGERDPLISRVPYLAGLDGLRAIAVVAVMIYHANSDWLPGGYLGVEMFFVISGYLITLLIIAERERTYRVSLRDFWARRARRLLPALGLLLVGVTIWTILFERDAVGELRGDVIAGLLYGSNWYQLVVGLGYTAAGDFAPLRHLWSLAVEEQFYVVWPLVMVLLLRRHGTRRVAATSRWMALVALAIAGLMALAYHPGVIGEPSSTPDAYWSVLGRDISKLDFLYLGSFSRASGILLGAALALVWRPYALRRSPAGRAGRRLDLLALVGLVGFGWMTVQVPLVTDDGAANGVLFRGGMLLASVFTIFLIAAVAHPSSFADRAFDRNLLRWIGIRSYGLYLYHWPVYQAIRGIAGNKLTVTEFALAMVITVVLAEASYRFVEQPVRQRRFVSMWKGIIASWSPARRLVPVAAVAVVGVVGASSFVLATAELRANEIEQSFQATEDDVVDLIAIADGASSPSVPDVATVPPPTTPPTTIRPTPPATTAPVTTVPVTTVPVTTSSIGAGSVDSAPPETTVSPAVPPVDTGSVPADPDAADAADPTEPNPSTTLATSIPSTATPPTTAPPSTAPVVPATTAPPPDPEPAPAPEPEVGARSRGVVADPNAVRPLGVDPLVTEGSFPVLALGDSVMRGAAEELGERGVVVDAVVSRQFTSFLPDVQAIRDAGLLGSVVVVHLGTNGSFSETSADQMMGLLADVPVVIFITGKADRGWIAGNNAIIRSLPDRYANVTVLDWEVIGSACGDCFYGDRIHLDPSGQQFYADLIGTLIGI
ncbi:MAG: acyltransferase family protein [Actinomycetota bacterium]